MNEHRDVFCPEHSGCIKEIKQLKDTTRDQWDRINGMNDKFDKVFTRINIILGGVIVACVGLILNLIYKIAIT